MENRAAATSVDSMFTKSESRRSELSEGDVQRHFEDLDDPSVLENCLEHIGHGASSNFVVNFTDDCALVQFDLSATSMNDLLAAERTDTPGTRWINLWYPSEQRAILEQLARRYDFSPRLLALMYSDPSQAKGSEIRSRRTERSSKWSWSRRSDGSRRHVDQDIELEKGNEPDELSEHSFITSADGVGSQGNLYWVLDDIWHYSSLDFGRSYVCVGYNTLYGTKNTGDEPGIGPLPYCKRVWTWLLLCEDSTVISINEDPFPQNDRHHTAVQQRILTETRRNLTTIFRSLSRVDEVPLMAKNPMTLLPIRTRLGDTPEETAHRESDAPGLLFYYLFENWQNSYTLVTRKESRYGVELQELRQEMVRQPQLGQIDRLDHIGRELGVLRRHYESYNRIIVRLLEPVTRSGASLANSRFNNSSQTSLATVRPAAAVLPTESTLGVSLSAAARVRFKRLKDMIDLYALCEVEEYLKQKESMVAMNFSLIAIKQSTDVERLTRVTLLLTKATILFLPVSLMTSYFDVNLSDLQYTVQQYWIAFAVIFCVSILGLFAFGVFSNSVQIFEAWQAVRNGTRRWWKSVRRLE